MAERTMTATSALPGAFWNAGPLFTSHTSPTPMMPLFFGWDLRKGVSTIRTGI